MKEKEIKEVIEEARLTWENLLPEEKLDELLEELRENLKEWKSVEAGLKEYRALLPDDSRHHEELPKYVALALLLGTPKDQVALAAWGNMEPSSNGRKEDVLVTSRETRACMTAAAIAGYERFDEIAKWVAYYEVLIDTRGELKQFQQGYSICIETLRIYAQSYYTLQEVDAYYAAMKKLYPDKDNPARVEADKRLNRFICSFSKIGPLSISANEDGWLDEMAKELLVQVTKCTLRANDQLRALKSAEQAIKDIVKRENLEIFVPTDMRDQLRDGEKYSKAGGFVDGFLMELTESVAQFADLPTDGDERASLLTYEEAEIYDWAYNRVKDTVEANYMITFKNHLYDYEAYTNNF